MSSTMIQIRNVPVAVHRRLKARAATEGVSMSEFVLREVRKALERPTRAEVLERLKARPGGPPRRSPTDVLREERDAR